MSTLIDAAGVLALRLRSLAHTLGGWPWLDTLRTLRLRFREDRLGLTAGSLTFATLIALVPLLTVMLAVFTAFPMFSSIQGALEKYFLQNLVPDAIARPVLRTLTQFTGKASHLGTAGLLLLVGTALAMMLTIDRTLNAIWRVRRPRPIAQRILVYWAALTLGPLAMGVSLTVTSYALSASRGLVGTLPGGMNLMLDILEFALMAMAMAMLFKYVPNTWVRWAHAWSGALFVALALEAAKRGLAWYVNSVASYATVYGAFATFPILLLWIYLGWVIVLLGAVIAAYAPSLEARTVRRPDAPGRRFTMAVALLGELARARATPRQGLSLPDLASALRTEALQLEPLLDLCVEFGWVGRLDEDGAQRHVLLATPASTPARPLLEALLLAPDSANRNFAQRARLEALSLADLIGAT